ncbi:MAG: hypothetical protein ABIH39_04030 [Candidatus Margulisiibacteriota bacterium]
MKSVVMVLVPILIGVVGQLFLKHGMMQIGTFAITTTALLATFIKVITNISVMFGFFLYGMSALLWLIVLSRMDLSFAYPLLSVGYILVLIFSWLFFKETVSIVRWSGVLVICFGVYLISRS